MSHPQQPMPDPAGASGESVPPSPTSPPPVPYSTTGVAAPPVGRPAGIVFGAIGMFFIGLIYIAMAIGSGVTVFMLGSHADMFASMSSAAGQFLTVGSTIDAEGVTDLRFLPDLVTLLVNLVLAVAAFTGGALVLMKKPVGRVLSLVVAGGAVIMACGTGARSVVTMLVHGGGPVWFQVVMLLVYAGLFVAAAAVIAMLAPRRVEEWMRQSGRAPAAMSAAPPVQAPMGQAPTYPAAGPVGTPQPPAANQPPPSA